MIIIASSNGAIGMSAAWAILQSGGSALDAIEAATRLVEDNPDDHSVGYGGYPNLIGEVELDASIMDGATRRAGAVGALRGYRHPISVARRVMQELPHVMLAGAGAERFAAECGMPREDLLTDAGGRILARGHRRPAARGVSQCPGHNRVRAAWPRHAPGDRPRARGRHSQLHRAGSRRQHRLGRQHQRLGLEVPRPPGQFADHRRGQLRRRSLRRGRLHRLGRAGHPRRHCPQRRAALASMATRSKRPAARRSTIWPRSSIPIEQCLMNMVALDRHGNHCAVTTASRPNVCLPGRWYGRACDTAADCDRVGH